MARRAISRAEERTLIAAAEQDRDDGTVGELAAVKVAGDATAVLSVRLPMDQLQSIRRNAASRGISISSLLQEAVAQLTAKPEPRMTATRQITRLWVRGAEPEMESGSGYVGSPAASPSETGGLLSATLR